MFSDEELNLVEQMCDVSLKSGGIQNLNGTLVILNAIKRERTELDKLRSTPVKEENPEKSEGNKK